jgi:electron transport complex protein RnfD
MEKTLTIHTSPHIHSPESVPKIMRQVILALIPVMAAAVYFFGLRSLLLLTVCSATTLLTEHICQRLRNRPTTIGDGSALITGILLALILPPAFPLWAAALGAIAGIVMGKMVFGGLGHNKFNPALVGRAFLQAAFPVPMTTWALPIQKFASFQISATTQATPLAAMKFQHYFTDYSQLLWGNVSGSIGETSVIAILIGGLYLVIRKYADWRIVAGIFISAILFSGILWGVNPDQYADPLFHLLSGGFMLGTFFMATDMVGTPTTLRGRWLHGIGIGLLIILIRTYSGLPEGVMYAILLMNAVSPLIDRYTQPKQYGHNKASYGGEKI